MPTSRLTSKGQTTIPLQVRQRLGLRQGDAIEFVFQADGSVGLRSTKRDVRSLKGLLHRPGMRTVPIEDMNAAVRHAAAKRYLRSAETTKGGRTSAGRHQRPRRS